MHQTLRNMSITNRLWLGFGSVLLLTTGSGAALWQAPSVGLAGTSTLHLIVAALGLSAVLISIGMVHWISRTVQEPLAQATAAIHFMAQGDANFRVKVERLDEVGKLLVALDDLGNYLAVMLGEDDSHNADDFDDLAADDLDRLLTRLASICSEIEDRLQACQSIPPLNDMNTAVANLAQAMDFSTLPAGATPAEAGSRATRETLRLLQRRAEQLSQLSASMLTARRASGPPSPRARVRTSGAADQAAKPWLVHRQMTFNNVH